MSYSSYKGSVCTAAFSVAACQLMDGYALSNLFDSYLPFGVVESHCFCISFVSHRMDFGGIGITFLLQEINDCVNINRRTEDIQI